MQAWNISSMYDHLLLRLGRPSSLVGGEQGISGVSTWQVSPSAGKISNALEITHSLGVHIYNDRYKPVLSCVP